MKDFKLVFTDSEDGETLAELRIKAADYSAACRVGDLLTGTIPPDGHAINAHPIEIEDDTL